jgi:type IV pilus assembly protein PilB
MFPTHSPAIYEFLKEHRLVEQAQLDELNEEHKATGKPLADVVVDLGIIEKSSLLHRIAEHLGYDYLSELPVQFSGEAIAAITGKLARDYGVMPLSADEQNIDLLVSDPFNSQAIDDLTFALAQCPALFRGPRQDRCADQTALR